MGTFGQVQYKSRSRENALSNSNENPQCNGRSKDIAHRTSQNLQQSSCAEIPESHMWHAHVAAAAVGKTRRQGIPREQLAMPRLHAHTPSKAAIMSTCDCNLRLASPEVWRPKGDRDVPPRFLRERGKKGFTMTCLVMVMVNLSLSLSHTHRDTYALHSLRVCVCGLTCCTC